MDSWPVITAPDLGMKRLAVKPARRTEFENGQCSSRVAVTKARHRFTLSWERMNPVDYAALEEFYLDHAGAVFSFTDPVVNDTHAVIFAGEELSSSIFPGGFRRVEVELSETRS